MTDRIMVLSDGETFTGLSGCKIVEVPAEWITEDIEAALAGNDLDGDIDLDDLKVIQVFE